MRSRDMRAGVIVGAAVAGSMVLSGCGDDDGTRTQGGGARASAGARVDAQEQGTTAVRAAYDKTAEAESARMTLKIRVAAGGETVTSDGKGVIDLDEGDSMMTLTVQGRTIEQRVVDQVFYQKVPGQKTPGAKPWIKIDLKKAAAQQGVNDQRISDPAQMAAYAKAITDKDVTKVGSEKIGGVDTTHYRVSVDVTELPGGARMREQAGPELPMEVWLDDEGRLRRQQIDMTVKAPAAASAEPKSSASPRQLKMSTVMDFSDFGTEIDAEAPPADQVADVTDQVLKENRKRS
ncbi:hypothetical protein [Streptomyces sp. NPDC126503]|uniref:hypothetical protein n=1 Tax=Streptomyces sp. NPDC126503 TaxID=3155315 RepID=UPI00332A6C21